jgi:transcriptional regulator with XRE-family HTH domain
LSELRSAIKASGLTLEELASKCGVHATTLSRATNGLRLSDAQEHAVRKALRAALKQAEVAAARERAKLMPSTKSQAEEPTAA